MTKPTYRYPEFVSKVELKSEHGKRYWLKLEIDKEKTEGIMVILKNPSRANELISDKTVYNVSNYIYRNRKNYTELRNVGTITILNLMPNYLTESDGLIQFKKSIIDPINIKTLKEFCSIHNKVIIAWGNHPKGLYDEYELLKAEVTKIISENRSQVFYVDKMTQAGNPKHGQVWGYKDELVTLKDVNFIS